MECKISGSGVGCKISGSGVGCKISGSGVGCKTSGIGVGCKISRIEVGCKISGIGVGECKTLASYCTSSLWVVLKLTLPLPCCVMHCFLSFMLVVVVNLCMLILCVFLCVF